ncbi:DJ-1/PfpI family protein [soil metagenome]
MNIALLLYHHVNELDLVGPYNALHTAKRYLEEVAEDAAFTLYTVAKARNSVETSGGLIITPHWAFASAPHPDVLVVPGGTGWQAASRDRAIAGYIREHAPRLRYLLGVCTGALLLGELGLLRDLRATTFEARKEQLRDYEVGEIVDERVVKNDSGLWCAGGVTAGIDAGLELVSDLHGRDLAERVAAHLNYPLWRPAEPVNQGSAFRG